MRLIGNGLEVRAASAQENPEILGWDIRRYEDRERVPATTLLHTQTGAGPRLLLTLFVPLKPGQTNPVAHVEPAQDGISATVTFRDGRKFQISAPGEQGYYRIGNPARWKRWPISTAHKLTR